MLSNHLTLDDEDAVQAELRELQAESVSQKWVTELSVLTYSRQMQKAETRQPSNLPSVPRTEPTDTVGTGEPEREHERVPVPA